MRLATFCLLWLFSLSVTAQDQNKPLVYVLAGQSNMEGSGVISEFPAASPGIFDDTYMYCGRCGPSINKVLVKMSRDIGFSTSESGYGPEMSFATEMRRATGRRIYLIKYAVGGTRLSGKPTDEALGVPTWSPKYKTGYPGNHLYENLVKVVNAGLTEIRAHSGDSNLGISGFVWMQGESDALDGFENLYGDSLEYFFRSISSDLGISKFVVGELSDYPTWDSGPFNSTRNQQKKVARANENVVLVKTRDLEKLSQDGILIHFNSGALVTLGSRMASAALRQINGKRPIHTP